MPWTNPQKSLFVQVARKLGLNDDQRKMILSQLPGGHGRDRFGRLTSTAEGLNNSDFEQAMATLEAWAGGQLPLRYQDSGRYRYGLHHFRKKADDYLGRMRSLVRRLNALLEQHEVFAAEQAGLRGFLRRMTADRDQGRTEQLDELDYVHLYNVIEALKAMCRRHGINPRTATFLGPGEFTTPAAGEAETYRDVLGVDLAGGQKYA